MYFVPGSKNSFGCAAGLDLVDLAVRRSTHVEHVLAVYGERQNVEFIEIRNQNALPCRIDLVDFSVVPCAEVDVALRVGRRGQDQRLLRVEDHVVARRQNEAVVAGQ